MDKGSRSSYEDGGEDKPCGYPYTDAILIDTCFEVTTMSDRGVECKGHGTIPTKGHLDPLLLGGGIAQDEIAHQPGSPTNFGGRSEARNISLIQGKARQSCAQPAVPLNYVTCNDERLCRGLVFMNIV